MIEIPLSSAKYPGLTAKVDDDDFALINSYRWSPAKARSLRTNWYAYCRSAPKVFMHSLITGYAQVDHEDGNGLNNQRYNLRDATQQQNTRNRIKTAARTTSRYKGVCWDRERSRWVAHIDLGAGRKKKLGRFVQEKDAALAYNKAALENFGEYALLNEVE